MKQSTIYEALQWASSFLMEHGREETSARILMQYLLKTNYSGLMMRMHDEINRDNNSNNSSNMFLNMQKEDQFNILLGKKNFMEEHLK